MSKVVVITGASAGIGAAAAELLARNGHSVVLVARRAEALAAVTSRCGKNALAITADVTDRAAVRGIVTQAIAHCGRIDVWVNNVGQGISRPPSELTDADVDEMMRLNVKTALYGMQEILPHFRERGDGHVINVSSMLGRIPFAVIRSAYCASKHYLNALTAMFREEAQATHPGIQFSLVSPPVVKTEFGLNAVHGGTDSRTMTNAQEADEVAAVIAEAIETRAPDLYTLPGAQARVAAYYAATGKDAAATARPGPSSA